MIVAIFLFYVFRLLNVTRRLRRKLESLSKNFSEDLIKKDVLFTQVWKDYQESFIEFNGGKKTDEFSYDYFNEKHLLSANTNLRLINSIPATLVGFGILGTFIGLTYGISNFQTSSTCHHFAYLALSVNQLILKRGCGTAKLLVEIVAQSLIPGGKLKLVES